MYVIDTLLVGKIKISSSNSAETFEILARRLASKMYQIRVKAPAHGKAYTESTFVFLRENMLKAYAFLCMIEIF